MYVNVKCTAYGNKPDKTALLKYNETNSPYYISMCRGNYAVIGTGAYGGEPSVYRLASVSLWCGGGYAHARHGAA